MSKFAAMRAEKLIIFTRNAMSVAAVKFTDTFVAESHISRECKSAVFDAN